MHSLIKELIDSTKLRFGLNNYYLERHSLSRELNILNETEYTLCMEWFPNHVTEQEDEDLNPEGTAVIDFNTNSQRYDRIIFVGGTSYAEGIKFDEVNIDSIINWIEQETGLSYGEQFKLHKEENGEFYFKACVDDIYISPSGSIEVNVDQSGNLFSYSKHGHFPSKEMIKKETYTLSLEKIEHLAWKQLKLINFPSSKHEKLIPIYGVDETYITNDGLSTLPYEFTRNIGTLHIDKMMDWDDPIHKPFERKEINVDWDATIEQALSNEPSPDSFPINETEREKCIDIVTDFLRREYSNDTGRWVLKTLQREEGYIHASLRLNQEDTSIFHRKLTIIIDSKDLQAINFIDNKPLIDHFSQFSFSEEVTINKKQAYQKIKDHFELIPRYVFDSQQNKYRLCGLLDCHYGIRASNGEIILLDDL